MFKELIDGVAIAINQAFGDTHEIYIDELPQGLKEPCFFILTLEPSRTRIMGSLYDVQLPVDVHHFPVQGVSKNYGMLDVAEMLADYIEEVALVNGDIIRGYNMHHEIVDGVMHFMITYKFHVRRQAVASDTMGEIIVTEKTKG